MARHILYAYVCGSDLQDIADDLITAFDRFIANRTWVCQNAHTVSERCENAPSLGPDDMQHWNLGLNVTLPDVGHETVGWFRDIIAVAQFLASLVATFRREFVMGIADLHTGISEDLHYIQSGDPELERLRAVIGVGPVE